MGHKRIRAPLPKWAEIVDGILVVLCLMMWGIVLVFSCLILNGY